MFDLLLFLLSDVLLRLCDSTEDRQGYRQFHFQLSLCTFSTASLRSVGNPIGPLTAVSLLRIRISRIDTRGIDYRGLGGHDPLKCVGGVRVCFDHLKYHILSFKTVVG